MTKPSPKYRVILIDVPTSKRAPILNVLMAPSPGSAHTHLEAIRCIYDPPSVVLDCIDLEQATFIELALEVAGATVEIEPARDCET